MEIKINTKNDTSPISIGDDMQTVLALFSDYEHKIYKDDDCIEVNIGSEPIQFFFTLEEKLNEVEIFKDEVYTVIIDGLKCTFNKAIVKKLQAKGHDAYIDEYKSYHFPSLNIRITPGRAGVYASVVLSSDKSMKHVWERTNPVKVEI